jgi:hypothetical protein
VNSKCEMPDICCICKFVVYVLHQGPIESRIGEVPSGESARYEHDREHRHSLNRLLESHRRGK